MPKKQDTVGQRELIQPNEKRYRRRDAN